MTQVTASRSSKSYLKVPPRLATKRRSHVSKASNVEQALLLYAIR